MVMAMIGEIILFHANVVDVVTSPLLLSSSAAATQHLLEHLYVLHYHFIIFIIPFNSSHNLLMMFAVS